MDITVILTVINVFLTLFSFLCAVFSANQKKQTEIMQKQLEHDLEPDYALASKLENISKAVYYVGSAVRDTSNKPS